MTFNYIAPVCMEKYSVHDNDLLQDLQGTDTLPDENWFSIKEIMINFLPHSVQMYIQNVMILHHVFAFRAISFFTVCWSTSIPLVITVFEPQHEKASHTGNMGSLQKPI